MRTIPMFMICALILLVSCQQSKKSAPMQLMAEPQLQTNCENNPVMLLLNGLPNQAAVLQWLTQNGSVICADNLFLCIEKRHVISKEDYDRAVAAHPDNQTAVKEYELTWGEVSTFITDSNLGCYDKYIGFTFADSKISLKTLDFTNSETCYSIPFLKGIMLENNLSAGSNLIFAKGRVAANGVTPPTMKEIVLIKCVTNAGTAYYDITDDPR